MPLFTELKITGLDADRPPRVRKEAYIDLFYQLSEDAPEEWCDDFESFGRQVNPQAKVDKTRRCFINTYVNDMNVIPAHFAQLKQAVADCNAQYQEKLREKAQAQARDNASLQEQGGLQFQLNEIIASLDFEQ